MVGSVNRSASGDSGCGLYFGVSNAARRGSRGRWSEEAFPVMSNDEVGAGCRVGGGGDEHPPMREAGVTAYTGYTNLVAI